jgi:hypothetical protein
MIKEHDVVVLREDIPGRGLKKGDRGVVVHCYISCDSFFEVEFENGNVVPLFENSIKQEVG